MTPRNGTDSSDFRTKYHEVKYRSRNLAYIRQRVREMELRYPVRGQREQSSSSTIYHKVLKKYSNNTVTHGACYKGLIRRNVGF